MFSVDLKLVQMELLSWNIMAIWTTLYLKGLATPALGFTGIDK